MIDAQWIKPAEEFGEVAPVYKKSFAVKAEVKKAVLTVTAMGVYEAQLNGKRVGNFILAPGWTA